MKEIFLQMQTPQPGEDVTCLRGAAGKWPARIGIQRQTALVRCLIQSLWLCCRLPFWLPLSDATVCHGEGRREGDRLACVGGVYPVCGSRRTWECSDWEAGQPGVWGWVSNTAPHPDLSGMESHWEVWHERRCLPHLQGKSVVPAKGREPFPLCGSPPAASASGSKGLGSLVFLRPALGSPSLSCCSLTCRLFAYIFLWLFYFYFFKSPAATVDLFLFPFCSVCFCFILFEAVLLEVYAFRILRLDLFSIMKCPSFSLVISSCLEVCLVCC